MLKYYVIATDDVDNIVKYDCLVALMSDFTNIQKCWKVNVYNNKVESIKEFPVNMIQSFYAHSSGMYSCKILCPEYIIKVINE